MTPPFSLKLAAAVIAVWSGPAGALAESRQWVAVTAPELRESLKPLEEARRKEGWEVTVLTAESDGAVEATRKRLSELAAKADATGPFCVVLAGDFSPGAAGFRVPTGTGTQLRMAGKPSDAPWNELPEKPGRVVETGRLPARTAAELEAMVTKILSWPDRRGVFPQARLVAGHHGAPPAFAGMADNLTNTLAQRLVSRLPLEWQVRAAVHVDGSPWQVSGNDLKTAAAEMLASPSTLLAYMGHSAPVSPMSKNLSLLGVEDWSQRRERPPCTGLFFSCGCFTTELDPKNESFGFAAMRAPGGPAAVIGSHGESFAAFGYLAMCGLVNALSTDPEPERLGQIWRGVREGLANAEISSVEFAMLDMSDGTGGKVPLAAQRLEHLESWMLLGDPAMPVLPRQMRMSVKATGPAEAGAEIKVEGSIPPGAARVEGVVRVTIERQPGSVPADLPEVPPSGPGRAEAARERRRLAENVVLAEAARVTVAVGGNFSTTLKLPTPLPAGPWLVRVTPVDHLIRSAVIPFGAAAD